MRKLLQALFLTPLHRLAKPALLDQRAVRPRIARHASQLLVQEFHLQIAVFRKAIGIEVNLSPSIVQAYRTSNKVRGFEGAFTFPAPDGFEIP